MSEESTTPDLVELVRRHIDAANRRDWDAIVSQYASEAVWDVSRFDLGRVEGSEAIRALFEDWTSAFGDWSIELNDVATFGDGVALATCRQRGRPLASGAYVDGREAFVYEWVDGVILRLTAYPDPDEARAAAERLAEERG
jgi:ketosteroid isomerase-like protein